MKQEAPQVVVEASDDGEWGSWAAISSGGEIEEKGESGRGGCIPKAAEADMREESNAALEERREMVTGETATLAPVTGLSGTQA